MPHSDDHLVREEALRHAEAECFISAVSHRIAMVADPHAVAGVSAAASQFDRRETRRLLRREDTRSERNGKANKRSTVPPLIAAALEAEPDTIKTAGSCGSPRGRPLSEKQRKWRVCDPGRAGLPPYSLQPSLSRTDSFEFLSDSGHRSFGPQPGLSDRSLEGPDPYCITEQFGWQSPSITNAAGRVRFFASMRKLAGGSESRSGGGSGGSGAHQMPHSWFPGSAVDHKTSTLWFTRDHGESDEAGKALTAAKKERGEAIEHSHRISSARARVRNEEAAMHQDKNRDKAAARERSEQLDMIDQQLARMKKDRDRALQQTREATEARRNAARQANRRVAAFRKRRSAGFDALAMHGASAVDGPNPLPLGTPFRYKAADLFKTFPEDERL